MDNLRNLDLVEVKETSQRGEIQTTRDMEPRFWVVFNKNAATADWYRTDQLTFIERPKEPEGSGFYPARSIMD